MYLHIQDLPDTASIIDVQNFFPRLDIPYGGIWILGGIQGDAFVRFSSHEELYKALMLDGMPLQGRQLKLSLADKDDIEDFLRDRFRDLEGEDEPETVPMVTTPTTPTDHHMKTRGNPSYETDPREDSFPSWQQDPRPEASRYLVTLSSNSDKDGTEESSERKRSPDGDSEIDAAHVKRRRVSSDKHSELRLDAKREKNSEKEGYTETKQKKKPEVLTTIVLADTRGEGLQELLDSSGIKHIRVLAEEETGLEEIVSSKLQNIRILQPDIIIITNGISDLTATETSMPTRNFSYSTTEEAVGKFMEKVESVYEKLSAELPETKIIFAPLTGCDLAKCNSQNTVHPQQDVLDQTVVELIKRIVAFNLSHRLITPRTSKIPKNYKGPHHHSARVLSNGYELNEYGRNLWVTELVKCTKKISERAEEMKDLKDADTKSVYKEGSLDTCKSAKTHSDKDEKGNLKDKLKGTDLDAENPPVQGSSKDKPKTDKDDLKKQKNGQDDHKPPTGNVGKRKPDSDKKDTEPKSGKKSKPDSDCKSKNQGGEEMTVKTVILSDDRGEGLQEKFEKKGMTNVKVVVGKEMGLQEIVKTKMDDIASLEPDVIIITNGFWDIISVDGDTQKKVLKYLSTNHAVKEYASQVSSTHKILSDRFSSTKIIYAPVTGCDLADWNNADLPDLSGDDLKTYYAEKKPHHQQEALNQLVVAMFRKVIEFNAGNKLPTPWVHHGVHKFYSYKYHDYYHLLKYGYQLSDTVKSFWVEKITDCIKTAKHSPLLATSKKKTAGKSEAEHVDQSSSKNKVKTVVLSDERGEGLQEKIEAKGMTDVHVLFEDQAGLQEIVRSKMDDIATIKPDLIIITNGLWDVISTGSDGEEKVLKYPSTNQAIKEYRSRLASTHRILTRKLGKVKIIYAPVTGCDLADFSTVDLPQLSEQQLKAYYASKTPHIQQEALNMILIGMFRQTDEFNQSNRLSTPWIHLGVHKFKPNSKQEKHCYHLLNYGHRLSDSIKNFWVDKIVECISIGQGPYAPSLTPEIEQQKKVEMKPEEPKNAETTVKTVLLCDERGIGLQESFEARGMKNVHVLVAEGAGLQEIVASKMDDLIKLDPDLIIVTNGFWDIVSTESDTGEKRLKYITTSQGVNEYASRLASTHRDLSRKFNGAPIIYATVTGCDLTDLNNPDLSEMTEDDLKSYHASKLPHPQQEALNMMIITMSKKTIEFNNVNKHNTPWVHHGVHKFYNRKYNHNYGDLIHGFKLAGKAKEIWMCKIVDCMKSVRSSIAAFPRKRERKISEVKVVDNKSKEKKRNTVILADERGIGLQEKFKAEGITKVHVLCEEGAGLQEVVMAKMEEISRLEPFQIIVTNGFWDIISEDSEKGKSVKYLPVPRSLLEYDRRLQSTHRILSRRFRNTKVTYAPVTGCDLTDLNTLELPELDMEELKSYYANKRPHYQQKLLNKLVIATFPVIDEFNKANKVTTPWLHFAVHRPHGSSFEHNYHLLRYGYKPSESVKAFWVDKLGKFIQRVESSARLPPPFVDEEKERIRRNSGSGSVPAKDEPKILSDKSSKGSSERKAVMQKTRPVKKQLVEKSKGPLRTVILSDARGDGLQEKFDAKGLSSINVLVDEEAGLEDIVSSKLEEIAVLQPDLICVMNGLFDIISTDEDTKSKSFSFTSSAGAVENYMKKVHSTHEVLSKEYKAAKVVYAPVVGCYLAGCRSSDQAPFIEPEKTKTPHPQQTMLNQTVREMHQEIQKFNKTNGVTTPLLFGTVHTIQNNKYCNYYSRLREGYNLSEALKDAWADRLARLTVRKGVPVKRAAQAEKQKTQGKNVNQELESSKTEKKEDANTEKNEAQIATVDQPAESGNTGEKENNDATEEKVKTENVDQPAEPAQSDQGDDSGAADSCTASTKEETVTKSDDKHTDIQTDIQTAGDKEDSDSNVKNNKQQVTSVSLPVKSEVEGESPPDAACHAGATQMVKTEPEVVSQPTACVKSEKQTDSDSHMASTEEKLDVESGDKPTQSVKSDEKGPDNDSHSTNIEEDMQTDIVEQPTEIPKTDKTPHETDPRTADTEETEETDLIQSEENGSDEKPLDGDSPATSMEEKMETDIIDQPAENVMSTEELEVSDPPSAEMGEASADNANKAAEAETSADK